MSLPLSNPDLLGRVSDLERENRLLKNGVRQLTRIREQWTHSLDQLKASKSRLQVANRFLDQLLHTAPLPILVVSRPWGRITMANAAAEALAGIGPQGLVGSRALRLLGHELRHDVLRSLATLTSRRPVEATASVALRTRRGGLRQLEIHWAEIKGMPGEQDRAILIAQDVSERLLVEQRLRFQSLHDPLTGLANRILFRDQLEQALAQGRRNRMKVGVMFLDLDGFKQVNDASGHAIGDQLLKQVASRLRSIARATDVIARFGGDEFAVVVAGIHHIGHIEIIARKLLASVSPPYHIEGNTCTVTVSIGVSVYPDDAVDIEALMRCADMAMYRVKSAGKNSYQFFTPEMNLEASRRRQLVGRMQCALDAGEFVAHFQPQVSLGDRRIVGLEALARWQHPSEGLLLPAAFIGLAEEAGLIQALGERILYQACSWTAAWHRQGGARVNISVNLSTRQLQDGELAALVRRVLTETGLDPTCLLLEIGESSTTEDLPASELLLRDISALGVQFALDRFGSGPASLVNLKRLPFSRIKIDRQLIQSMEADASGVAIADAIIRMGGALGLTVVAAGVETVAQLRLLEVLKCDLGQGHYFARPMLADDCGHLMSSARSWGSPC